jgi:hypothetical protein
MEKVSLSSKIAALFPIHGYRQRMLISRLEEIFPTRDWIAAIADMPLVDVESNANIRVRDLID